MRVISSMATNIDHAVDRGGSPNHLATRADKPPPAKRRLWFCQIAPVIARHVHRIGQGGRHLDQRAGVGAAIFQHQDTALAILTKPVGKGASGGSRPDDDVVIALCHDVTIKSRSFGVKQPVASAILRMIFQHYPAIVGP